MNFVLDIDLVQVLAANNTTGGETHLSNAELKAVSIISLLTSGTSCLGSLSVLICSVYSKRVFYPEVFPTFHLAVADVGASFTLLISSIIYLSHTPGFPGAEGPCDYMMTLVTSLYTSAFFLTLAYAMEALFRFRRRLSDGTNLDSLQVRVMSSRWMLLVYVLAWLLPLSMATVLMIYTNKISDDNNNGGFSRIYPKQCSSCFADFRFNEDYCWDEVEDGIYWHYVIRLIFLLPLMVVMAANMVSYRVTTFLAKAGNLPFSDCHKIFQCQRFSPLSFRHPALKIS
ncbi:transmembrane protein 116-like [Plakobranchus ocellatus]|uniref:Transmembrane protein 116-like n=1 Tax=Plakobranchus ocellatus TaxID=259542 RepID=A0AAV4BA58_9GAST|nr:transmembrane protein 116-like [Plakobranchus ocellatus]